MFETQFGEIRSLLQRGPGAGRWAALCERVEAWPAPRFERELLPYLLEHTRAWPARLCPAPQRWVDALLAGQGPVYLAMARALDLGRQRPDTAELEHLTRCPHLRQLGALDLRDNELEAPAAALMARARWPRLRWLCLRGNHLCDLGARALARSSWIGGLRALDLSGNRVNPAGVASLGQRACGLTELRLGSNRCDRDAIEVLGQLPELETLDLTHALREPGAMRGFGQGYPALRELTLGPGLDDEAMEVVGEHARLPALDQLRLRGGWLGPAGIGALERARFASRLRALDLSMNPQLGAGGARALARAAGLAGLRALNLDGCALGPAGAAGLSDAPWLRKLEVLRLRDNALRDEGCLALLRAPTPALQTLSLSNNQLSTRAAVALAQTSQLGQLRELDISYNDIGDVGADHLARAPWMQRLEALHLSGARLGPRGAGALARASAPALERLTLRCHRLGDEGLAALSQASWFAQLRALDLEGCGLGPAAGRTLAQAPLPALTELRLAANHLGAPGVAALATAALPALRALDLRANAIGDRGAEALARAPWLRSLRSLRLPHNQLGSRGAEALGSTSGPSDLEELDLGSNRIADEGALALSRAHALANLRVLSLDGNHLSVRGALALLHPRHLPRLERLRLLRNAIAAHDVRPLAQAPWASSLREVSLWWNSLGASGRALLEQTAHPSNARKLLVALTS